MIRHGAESPLYRWGRFVYRFRRAIVATWIVLFCLMIPFAILLPSMLQQNGFTPANSPALEGVKKLEEGLGLSSTAIDIVVVSRTGENLTTGTRQKRILRELEPLLSKPYVQDMHINIASRNPGQDHIQWVTVQLKEDTAEALKHFDEIREAVPEITGADTYLTGNTAVFADMNEAVKKDIFRAELIGMPLALIILLLVFRTVTAAVLPLIAGLVSVSVTMGALYFGAALDGAISNFLPNVVTMLGLAVGIDYALFVVSRFREEIARADGHTERAVAVSCATAGKAVIFSGAAVWIGFLAMAMIELPIFKSFSMGGITVVLVSVLAANTLLPALLGMLGPRIDSLPLWGRSAADPVSGQARGAWRKISAFVMARPVVISAAVIALLLLTMLPVKSMKAGIPAAEVLPPSYDSRYGFELLKQAYDERELSPIIVAAELPDAYGTPQSIQAVKTYMDQVRRLPEVHRVESYVSLTRGTAEESADYITRPHIREQLEKYHVVRDRMAAIAVVPKNGDADDATQALVAGLRKMETPGLRTYITGNPPYKLDILQEMKKGIPSVLLFVFITTYIILFAAFRSVILPLKAVVMNVLSLGAGLGIVVRVFQEGAGAGWLGVSHTGSIFALLPILIFCVVFGISMDYEVILLSRIKESYQATGDNELSTAEGLEKTGGMITSAALILAVVVGAFIFTDNEVMKAIGLGLTAAVLLDATVVRILLVPAFMKLLGRANWWSPAWLFPSRKRRDGESFREDPV
ncbi:MMPL family transporter [Paenibacillus sp. DMB20]|uniref:MMPL family transporter n=1 Tax=Paenibacillus sp. DMB20 TaxID=1642570 RepID=UPI000627DE30|nr:MMPL family transporter [Paenibacillus sp. DMB20]KKO53713.1 membrane protein [Paenibacillus sp. DMB20]